MLPLFSSAINTDTFMGIVTALLAFAAFALFAAWFCLATDIPAILKKVLKDFSLPISMSFRLFGALLSGLLVTELVYHYVALSFVLPVFVGVVFTLLHALIQAYVLTTLVSIFFGEAVEPPKPKEPKPPKERRRKKNKPEPEPEPASP